MKIVFAGTPDFSVPILQALIDSSHQLLAVYTQPDKPAGRGRKLQQSPIKQLALQYNIEVQQPEKLKKAEAVAKLAEYDADLIIVVAYGLILSQAALDCANIACINIHASLLPRWRGAAPIQRAILAGDQFSGVAIMQMQAGLDTGPVYREAKIPIAVDDTAQILHDRLAQLGADTLIDCLPVIQDGSLIAIEQSGEGINYAKKLSKQEALIDWQDSAEYIERAVRAFNPWPVSYTLFKGKNLRIWQVSVIETTSTNTAGLINKVTKTGFEIACGQGSLLVTELQLAGKRRMSAKDFSLAHQLEGLILGIPSSID